MPESRKLVLLAGVFLLTLVNLTQSGPIALRTPEDWDNAPSFGDRLLRKRSPTVSERPGCKEGATIPPNRVNTTKRLIDLRIQMDLYNISAYIVTSDNAHQGEEVAPHDHRREFICGLSGSSGTAVITKDAAAVWTDGRYFLQAENELDCNWILMKDGEAGVPNITAWLREVLKTDEKVAADPTLIGTTTWQRYDKDLTPIEFEPLSTNLIDVIWTTGRPPVNTEPGFILHLNYSGESWQDKVDRLRAELPKQGADALVITALDEVAWLLNIRGSDVPNHPVLLAYMYVSSTQLVLFAETSKISSPEMQTHLTGVTQRPYDRFVAELPDLAKSASMVLIPSQFVYTGGASYAVYNAIPETKRLLKPSPVLMMKAKKNTVEAEGMMNAHLKDAVALCDVISLMVEEIPKGVRWDELKVSAELLKYRAQQEVNKGASFNTIAGYGPNGAIIHYSASEETNAVIGTTSLFLLDSGGQYFDGTTDVTRTLHFGTPTAAQIKAYTLVLMGHLDLARLVFPKTTRDARVDVLARAPLFDQGLDYLHGTGHGIGHFGSIHESPTRVALGSSVENTFFENYFFSDEPGYYKAGDFGIRIESILRVIPTTFSTEFPDRFFRFQAVTLVPFERKLIDVTMLSDGQIDYVNDYYILVRQKVGAEMTKQNRTRAYNWLISQTEPLMLPEPVNKGVSIANKQVWVGIWTQLFISMFVVFKFY